MFHLQAINHRRMRSVHVYLLFCTIRPYKILSSLTLIELHSSLLEIG